MKIKLLVAGAAMGAVVTLMTGCHTVTGTVEGAATGVQRDVGMVANPPEPTPVRATTYHHRVHHRHHTVAKKHKASMTPTTTGQATGAATNEAPAAAAPAAAQDANQTAQ